LVSLCLADRSRYGPPAGKRHWLSDTARSSRRSGRSRFGIVPLGEVEKTLSGERIGILGEIAGKHRALSEKLTIHRPSPAAMSALQDT
jgi:hypothetical protein